MKSVIKNSVTYDHFPFFDGVRALSILWVIIHHIPVGFPKWFEAIRIRGDLGVELFFTISGFLVVRSLHQSFLKSENTARIDFLKKRFFRILPPFYITLLLIGVMSFVDKSLYSKLLSIKDIIWSFPLFLYNYFRSVTSGTIPGTLNIFWSLCFEEQFYLGLFFLSFLIQKFLVRPLLSY